MDARPNANSATASQEIKFPTEAIPCPHSHALGNKSNYQEQRTLNS